MWANRITLDYIKHQSAKEVLEAKLIKIGITDEQISNLYISAEDGYVCYRIELRDGRYCVIFDNGQITHNF